MTNKRAKCLSNHVAFLEFQLLKLLKHLLWGCLPLNMVPDEDSDDDDDGGDDGGDDDDDGDLTSLSSLSDA